MVRVPTMSPNHRNRRPRACALRGAGRRHGGALRGCEDRLLLSAEGFSGEEIADTIGRSHSATRTLLSRARVRVRLDLEQHGDDR